MDNKCWKKGKIYVHLFISVKLFMTIVLIISIAGKSRIRCYASDNIPEWENDMSMQQLFDNYVDMRDIDNDLSEIADINGQRPVISFQDIFDLLMDGNIEGAISNSFDSIC